jgi:hypothetical protein
MWFDSYGGKNNNIPVLRTNADPLWIATANGQTVTEVINHTDHIDIEKKNDQVASYYESVPLLATCFWLNGGVSKPLLWHMAWIGFI